MSYLYQSAFLNNQFGYGAAIGWALFILIVLFSIINWRLIGGDERIARRAARRSGRSRPMRADRARNILSHVVLMFGVVLSIFPFYWMVVMASNTTRTSSPTRRSC